MSINYQAGQYLFMKDLPHFSSNEIKMTKTLQTLLAFPEIILDEDQTDRQSNTIKDTGKPL